MLATRYDRLATVLGRVGGLPLFESGDDLGFEILVQGGLGADFGEQGILAVLEELADRNRGGVDLLDVEGVIKAAL